MKRIIRATLTAVFATIILIAGAVPEARADYSYDYYESRSDVVAKAGWLNWTAYFMCAPIPWYISFVCSTGSAGTAYDFAAERSCKMRVLVTINTSSQYSYDKASYRYYPYECLG
jgi:hypothetical protein